MARLEFIMTFLVLITGSLELVRSGILPKSRLYHGDRLGGMTFRNGKVEIITSSSKHPYMAEIFFFGHHHCGGVIIRLDIVLSAGHCFNDTAKSHLIVQAGHLIMGDKTSSSVQKRGVKKIIQYDKNNLNFDDDIAIVQLKKPFYMTNYVDVIELPDENQRDSFTGETAMLLGWGETETGMLSTFLQKIHLQILSPTLCSTFISQEIAYNVLCGLGKDKKVVFCTGDSGGPFVMQNMGKRGKDLLIGIISYGFDIKSGDKDICDATKPSVGTNIAYYKPWISKTLKKLNKNN